MLGPVVGPNVKINTLLQTNVFIIRFYIIIDENEPVEFFELVVDPTNFHRTLVKVFTIIVSLLSIDK